MIPCWWHFSGKFELRGLPHAGELYVGKELVGVWVGHQKMLIPGLESTLYDTQEKAIKKLGIIHVRVNLGLKDGVTVFSVVRKASKQASLAS